MDPLFTCPPAASLEAIPVQDCPEAFDQIVKIAFQRAQSPATFDATTIITQAPWTAALAASDDTKIVITPYLLGLTIPAGEILKEGGNDNSTINGVPKINGRGFVSIAAQLHNAKKEIRAAIRKLLSESALQPGATNLWMYMFNRSNQIIANSDGSGIDAFNVLVGDVGTEGFNKDNIANFNIDLAPGWSDDVVIFKPTAFKPLAL